MFALCTAGSIAFGALFWGWALHGGAALEPRTAARIFGWLCIACTSAGLFFALRGTTAYDRPGPALIGALATTLLTGCSVLYLSYFHWESRLLVAEARPAAAVVVRESAVPLPAALPLPAPPPATSARAPQRPKVGMAKVAHALPRPAGPCAGLRRLAGHQCLKCSGESGLSRFFCEENARAEYCAERDGTEPGCPWRSTSRMD